MFERAGPGFSVVETHYDDEALKFSTAPPARTWHPKPRSWAIHAGAVRSLGELPEGERRADAELKAWARTDPQPEALKPKLERRSVISDYMK